MPETEGHLNETVGQVLSVLSRRRWWIAGTACGVALATIGVSLLIPNRYTAEATLTVVQQQVSARFVEPGTTAPASEVIQAMTREILSRARLIGIINELGLYSDLRQHATIDAVAERMRYDVAIEPLDQVGHDYDAFKVSFTARDPYLAQAVTSRLASLFIEENIKTRGDRATKTTSFLAEQLETARKKLAEQEQRLQAFTMNNISELPGQQTAGLSRTMDLRIELQNATANLSRAQQQRSAYEATIRGTLAGLESEKTALLVRYTPRHSEVIKKDQEIGRWEELLEHWKTGAASRTTSDSPSIAALGNQIDANAAEIEKLSREQQSLSVQVEQYQNRINMAPIREQQLADIKQAYEMYKQQYEDLQSKQLQSQLARNLEDRQEGQQFRLMDPPVLPLVPTSPKRVKICLGGLGGGLFLGLALAFFMDTRDHCFHLEKELSQTFRVPLVLGIPLLLTPQEERQRSWKRLFEWVAVGTMAAGVLMAELYIYRFG